MIARLALTSLLFCGVAHGVEFTAPGTATSYQFDQDGRYCFVGYTIATTNGEQKESGASNTVCKNTPAQIEWQAPTENEDGSAIDTINSYRFVATAAAPEPMPPQVVANLTQGSWKITVIPPGEYLNFPMQAVNGKVDAGNWNADPDAGLRIEAVVVRDPSSDRWSRIVSKAHGNPGDAHVFMVSQTDGNLLRFRLTTSSGYKQLVSTRSFFDNVETRVVATYDNSQMCIQIDSNASECVNHTGTIQQNNDAVAVAANPDGYSKWVGRMSVQMGRF